ncbi:MAG: Spo0B domain-containing protein [Bacillota bacterium]|jgi:hypothetical protein
MRIEGLELFRRFRHDLLNELQILSGHMQLGRPQDELRRDLQNVVERIQEVSYLFSCRNDQLGLLLWKWLQQARDAEISISFELLPMETNCCRNLAAADGLVQALLLQIGTLAEQDRWLHVRLEGNQPMLSVIAPQMPLEFLLQTTPKALQQLESNDGEELRFTFGLS